MLADTQGLEGTRSQPRLLTGNSGAEGDPRLGSRLQKFHVKASVGPGTLCLIPYVYAQCFSHVLPPYPFFARVFAGLIVGLFH